MYKTDPFQKSSVNVQEAKSIGFLSCVFWDSCGWTQWGAGMSVEHWNQPAYLLIMPSESITGSVSPSRAAMLFSTDSGFSLTLCEMPPAKSGNKVFWWRVQSQRRWKNKPRACQTWRRFLCKVNNHLMKKNNYWLSVAAHKTK